jgi:hypothetical protein
LRTDPSTALRACAALPPLVLVVLVGAVAVAAMAGRDPRWHGAAMNMSEAAAARDVATIAAMLDRGEDPNRPRSVRPPLLDSTQPTVAPLEAGALAGRLEVVDLLVTRGASLDARRRRALVCETRARGYRDVADYLAGAAVVDCP